MTTPRYDVLADVRATFPPAAVDGVLTHLAHYGAEAWERERERVQCAIVRLAEGDEAKLLYFLAVAKTDYRDVLFWADCPDEAKIDTPEKKRQLREALQRIGMAPPPGLLDA